MRNHLHAMHQGVLGPSLLLGHHVPALSVISTLAGPFPHVTSSHLFGLHTQVLNKHLSNKNNAHITIYTRAPKNLCKMLGIEFWSSWGWLNILPTFQKTVPEETHLFQQVAEARAQEPVPVCGSDMHLEAGRAV